MITKYELNNIPCGIYRFYWASGGSSVLAVGVTREGGRWIAPLNWTSPGLMNNAENEVLSYELLMSHTGETFFKNDPNSSLNRAEEILEKSDRLIAQLEEMSEAYNKKSKKNHLGIGMLVLGFIVVSVLIIL